jgi:hypothetical protein
METQTQIRARIKSEARRGDWMDVALRVGKSADLVRRVVRGTRNNDKILAAFIELLDSRVQATVKFQSPASEK